MTATTTTRDPADAVVAAVAAATERPAPPVWHRLYGGFVDTGSPSSWSSTFRARRFSLLLARFPDLASMRVLDLGGTAAGWSTAPVRPAALTLVNREPPAGPAPPGTELVVADVCDLHGELTAGRWDLVFSNSVIEHVGGHERRQAFADAVRRLAPHHWVQTPYRYFPVEPHFLVPALQFLPTAARAWIIERWPLNRWRPADHEGAMEAALGVELLGTAELAHYFPTSTIVRERLGPLTKSIVATG